MHEGRGTARVVGARAREARARVGMEFKLNLEPPDRRTVNTDLSVADLNQRLSNAARGGLMRTQAATAGATGSLQDKLERAREAGRNMSGWGTQRWQQFEQRWHGWLKTQNTNFWLLISNILYLAVTIAALVLALLCINEHVGDFRRNEFTKHKNEDGTAKVYPPCGIPTPDSMYLLQAIGALPAAGWDGASLEPDYKNWMQKVDRAICARIVPGKEVPFHSDANGMLDMATCQGSGYIDYGTGHAEELLAIGYLMDDATVMPTLEDIDDENALADKKDAFERRTCLVKKANADKPEEEPFYTEQQRNAYGDLKTRVARAYIAAMPAFSRYQLERETCAEAHGFKDPFDEMCKHSCHLRNELKAASDQQVLMYTTDDIPDGTTFTKQLYRLLALSLAGYYDRYHNNGKCFRNIETYDSSNAPTPIQDGAALTAYDFCANSMKPTGPGNNVGFSNKDAVTEYTKQNQNVELNRQCGNDAYSPPPPAPPVYRNDANLGVGTEKLSAQVCAATLQYGLFEQGRLFGIPDVIAPFVIDNRVDRSLHFIGEWIYDAMYVTPMKKAGDILADPKSKLEMYIAYRMASTSIWVILVANVAGYMMVRALAPTLVWILKAIGVRTNVPKSAIAGAKLEFEPIVLVRPQLGWPLYLAQFVNLLVIYWIFWIDPATQSHHYITTGCDDWSGLGVQVPSGAFVTSWGKRRFARFGEHVIGVLLAFTFLFVIFQQVIGRSMVSPATVAFATKVKVGATARLDRVALIMIAFALIIQILFIAQSIFSGDDWYQSIKASANDHAILVTFSKDCLMSCWAAFWTSASISWYRQKWAIDKLPNMYQYAWMVSALVLLWMPVFHQAAYLSNEIEVAFSDGKGTTDTPRLIISISIYVFSGIWTAVLFVRLRAVWMAMPKRTAPVGGAFQGSENAINGKKYEVRQLLKAAKKAHADQKELNEYDWLAQEGISAPQPMFDLSGIVVPSATVPVQPQRKTDAVYMPLLPSQ